MIRSIVLVMMSWGLCAAALAAEVPATEFDDLYQDVAAYVMNPANSPDLAHGRVQVEFGDAKAYLPAWIYARAMVPGLEPSEQETAIAREIVQRYQENFDRLEASPLSAFKDFNSLMDAAIGIEGAFKSYEHDPRPEYRDLFQRYLDFAKPVAARPGLLMNYHLQPYGPATVIAGGAWFYLEYALVMGPDDPRSAEFKRLGLQIIAEMDRRLYSAPGKKYLYSERPGYDFTYVYNNAVLVQALVRAYALTGERRYYDRGLELMTTLERDLYHPGYQGWLAAEDSCRYSRQYQKIGPQYNREYMPLSGHNYLVYAYLALFEAGGMKDERLLENAARGLRFIRNWLWDRQGKIQHHIERGKISGPADYCMGCNFETLYHIVQYKAALMKIPTMKLMTERNP